MHRRVKYAIRCIAIGTIIVGLPMMIANPTTLMGVWLGLNVVVAVATFLLPTRD